jgi:hypothetical protein
MEGVEAIVKRAAADPEFLSRFVEDPVGAAKAEGIEIPAASTEEMVAALQAAGDAGQQVAELLQQRVSQMGLSGGIGSFSQLSSHGDITPLNPQGTNVQLNSRVSWDWGNRS